MKTTEKLKEIRGLSVQELRPSIESTEQELMNLRFRHAAGQLEQTSQLKTLRRKVARARTVLSEKVGAVREANDSRK